MTRTLIRYKAKPDMADRNAELIAEVFEELKAAQPEGFAIFRCGSTTARLCISSRPNPIPGVRFRDWPLSRRSRAEFVSAASNRRSLVAPPLSATIGCSPNHRHRFRKQNGIVAKSTARHYRH